VEGTVLLTGRCSVWRLALRRLLRWQDRVVRWVSGGEIDGVWYNRQGYFSIIQLHLHNYLACIVCQAELDIRDCIESLGSRADLGTTTWASVVGLDFVTLNQPLEPVTIPPASNQETRQRQVNMDAKPVSKFSHTSRHIRPADCYITMRRHTSLSDNRIALSLGPRPSFKH